MDGRRLTSGRRRLGPRGPHSSEGSGHCRLHFSLAGAFVKADFPSALFPAAWQSQCFQILRVVHHGRAQTLRKGWGNVSNVLRPIRSWVQHVG